MGDTGAMDSPDRLAGVNKKMIKEKDEKIASLQEKFLKLVSFNKILFNYHLALKAGGCQSQATNR